MTTNKPEVFTVCDLSTGKGEEAVSLSDYEALQAECEKLRADNALLIEDRARFPDRPDFVGDMISARLGNLKAGKEQAEKYARKWCNEAESLQAECEKLRREASTEQEIQRAAEVLPTGYRIEIEVENGCGSVALFSRGTMVECDFHGGIAEQIADAIDAAMHPGREVR